MTYNNLPMRTIDMYHNLVHDLVRTCTSNHAHQISSLYAHDPHHAHLVELSIMPICQLCIVEMHLTMAVLLVEIVCPIIVEVVCI